MKAIVYKTYGAADVLHLADVPKPTPKDDEVLIRIFATTVTTGDWRARSLQLPRGFGFMGRLVFGLFSPRQQVLGTELSGRIEAIGKNVTRFKVGDDVFAMTGAKYGAYAEYRCMPQDGLVAKKPANVSYQHAAALSFGGNTALHFLRSGNIEKGDKVLINGASGGVGTACVQIAKYFGAEVTGVCGTSNVALVKSIGADHVIDYTKEDFAKGDARYDIIVDTVGTAPYARSRHALKEDGRLLVVLGTLGGIFTALWVSLTSKHKVVAGPATERLEDLELMAKLTSEGCYTPVIDHVYPMDEIVEAHRRVDSGRKRGNIIVAIPA